MSDHEKICEILPLAASGALDASDEQRVAQHVAACPACAAALDGWRELARGLERLPTPLAPAAMVERARLAVNAHLAAEAERRWNRKVLAFLILFAWTITLAGWPVFRLVAQGVAGWLDPSFDRTWLALVTYTVITWMTAGVAAALLALRRRHERRLA